MPDINLAAMLDVKIDGLVPFERSLFVARCLKRKVLDVARDCRLPCSIEGELGEVGRLSAQ